MEDFFYDFDSQYLENKFPTVLEMKEIKQMLLSGDRDEILKSVEKIKVFLNCDESLSAILRSDISEFLCDAIIPFDTVIVCALYQSIELMTKHVEFFSHNHSCFAIESVMRTLHFILKDSSSITGLNQCLNLLNSIMQGYNTHGVPPEEKTIENLLHLLPILLTNLPPTLCNKYQTGALIFCLMELEIIKWSEKTCDVILTNFSSWFNFLIEILESEHPMREKLILLSSSLCHSVLRFLVAYESSAEEFNFEISVNLKNDTIRNVIEFLISIGAPYFDSVPLSNAENDPSHLENFYQTILTFYNESRNPETARLTHGLSEMGFLQLTTRLISFLDFSHGQKLRRLCVLVLFHAILYLSEEVLLFPEVWAAGRDDFRREVQNGVSQLPTDATQWLNILIDPQGSPSSKLALLLYLYFYSMTARSQDMLQVIYPAVVGFIRITDRIDACILLMKIVWFVFVMSQLSVTQNSSLESETDATNSMVALLEAQQDLSFVYTHHPALLYWAFSSQVSSQIQTQIVYLWLRNKTPDCKELDEMMMNSADARFAILDILQNGSGHELCSAFSSLKSLLSNPHDGEDDLAASIWFLLPQILAKFTADSTSVTNVDYVIELCSLKTPRSIDVTRIIRVAALLPEVLLKSDLISVVPSLSLIFRLMKASLQVDDHRVLCVFLRHEGFLLKILEGLEANAFEVSFFSVQIIVLLWEEGKEIKNLQKRDKIEISKSTILKLLETECEHVLSAAFAFLRVILLSNFQSPIFEIAGVDAGFLEILFLEIQNICIKSGPIITNHCWDCLKLFLILQPIGSASVQGELVTNPVLHQVVLSCLPQLNDSNEFREFVSVWIDLHETKFNDPCFGRKIFGGFFSDTMQRIAMKLMENCKSEDKPLLEKAIRHIDQSCV